MKRSSQNQNRMVSMLGIWAIFIITAIILTACTYAGTDYVPTQQAAPVSGSNADKDAGLKFKDDTAPQAASVSDASAQQTKDRDSSSSSRTDTRRRARYDEPFQVPTYQSTGDGYIWYNNEEFNYTLKFPEWMDKKIGTDGNIVLTGKATNNVVPVDRFTINARFIELPEGSDSMSWFAKLENQGDQKVTYKGYTFKLEAVADTEGPYARRAYVPLAERGALELTFTYDTSGDKLNKSFEKKATEGYYGIINSATELFLSN